MRYDAIVVGAGPAGSIAAWHLARAGRGVLLLEKEGLGRDKPCGGGLTARSYTGLGIPIEDLVLARVNQVELRRHGRTRAKLSANDSDVWMVRRCDFDKRLAETARDAGADLHEREPASFVAQHSDGVTVETSKGRYDAQALLIAAGAENRLSDLAGFSSLKRSALVAIELEGQATSTRLTGETAVLDYALPGGYMWAFPKGDIWNVGVGSERPQMGKALRKYLQRFVSQLGLCYDGPSLVPERAKGRRIPIWSGPRTLHNGRIALLGDSAGLADPFFAEGIAGAIISGRHAALATLSMLEGKSPDLGDYSTGLQQTLSTHMRRTSLLYRLVYPAPGVWMKGIEMIKPAQRLAERVVSEPFPDA